MNEANDLIERMERETGQRIDDNDGDNMAMTGLFGAIARMMGKTPASYTERDDVAAGKLIQHQMSPGYQREREGNEILVAMLCAGLSPDDIKEITG